MLACPIPYNQDAVGVVAVLSEDRRPWSAEAELALLAYAQLRAQARAERRKLAIVSAAVVRNAIRVDREAVREN